MFDKENVRESNDACLPHVGKIQLVQLMFLKDLEGFWWAAYYSLSVPLQ